MENRLRNLRNSMKKTTFRELNFTDQHRIGILKEITKQVEKEDDIILAVLQLLVQEKTGYELAKSIRSRGIKKYEDNEGLLYTLLHRLEQTGSLTSCWKNSETKLYCLNDKGQKILRKAETKHSKQRFILKEFLEGDLL